MQRNVYLSLVLITLLAFIIISGCGGGNDGITQPSSITTPTATPSGSGYLVIDVVWPKEEAASGKCIISSGKNDKDIIASIPKGTIKVVFSVYEYDELKEDHLGEVIIKGNPYEEDPFAPATIMYPATRIILTLPAVKVLVKAESWGFNFNSLQLYPIGYKISDPVQIKPGMNEVELPLGNQGFTLKAIPPDIALQYVSRSSAIVNIAFTPTPVPGYSYDSQKGYYPIIIAPTPCNYSGETQIIARLVVESPDIPEATPTPPFIGKENSNSNNTLESQGVMGLENFEVKFKVIDGDGTLYPIGSQESQETVSAYTASDGYCNAILKTTQPGDITVQASCELVPGDPNSIITRECYVAAIQPPTPTPEPTETPEPTAIPTPLPNPPYPDFIAGAWQEQMNYYQKPTGKSYTITVTHPVFVPNSNVKVWMGIISTDENGHQQEGMVVTNPIDNSCSGYIWLPGRYGHIHNSPGFASFNGIKHHGILWGSDPNGNYLLPWVQ